MDEVIFSIIVPIYNMEGRVSQCLDSIRGQTFSGWNCILVDDGSSDNTLSVLLRYANNDKRFIVVHQENGGVSKARNKGLEMANGRYVLFVDADDSLMPATLSCLEQIINGGLRPESLDIIIFSARRGLPAYYDFDVNVSSNQFVKTYDMSKVDDIMFCIHNYVGGLLAWNGCFRRGMLVANSIWFKPLPNGEDVLWGAECIFNAKSIGYTPLELYNYIEHEGTASNSYTQRHLSSIIDVASQLQINFLSYRHYELVRSFAYRKIRSILVGDGYNVLVHLPRKDYQCSCGRFLEATKDILANEDFAGYWQRVYSEIAASNIYLFMLLYVLPYKFALRLKRIAKGLKGAI